jgi:4-hydroxy-3-polyprenylbenzoate decarboxylase
MMVSRGIVAISLDEFSNYDAAVKEIETFMISLKEYLTHLQRYPFIIICNDPDFVGAHYNNFLWVTFTRCNPSHDIYGIDSFTQNKHWGCNGPLVFDARIKPHHAPPVKKDADVEKNIDRLFEKGGSLYNKLKG